MIIYKIINLVNNKIYIGKTSKTLEKRFYEHCFQHMKNKTVLRKAVDKYGTDSFKIELIEECSEDGSNEKEIYYINFYNSIKNGYNSTVGGDGASFGEMNVSKRPEVREKLKYNFLGKKHTEETKRKISNKLKGTKLSDETKRKISESCKGHKSSAGEDSKLSKSYIVITPQNNVLIIKGMRGFCRDNNLEPRSMRYCINGKMKQHKGFKCFNYNEDKYKELKELKEYESNKSSTL